MDTRRLVVVLAAVALLGGGCKKKPSTPPAGRVSADAARSPRTGTPPRTPPPADPRSREIPPLAQSKRDPLAYGCKVDADCELLTVTDGDCCPHKCYFRAYPFQKDFAKRLKAHYKTACKGRSGRCEHAKCSRPMYWLRAACRGGWCAAEIDYPTKGPRRAGNPPRISYDARHTRGCRTNADCVVSCAVDGACADDGCSPCKRVYNREFLQSIQAARRSWCKPGTWSHPQYDCPKPRHRVSAECQAGLCQAVEQPL